MTSSNPVWPRNAAPKGLVHMACALEIASSPAVSDSRTEIVSDTDSTEETDEGVFSEETDEGVFSEETDKEVEEEVFLAEDALAPPALAFRPKEERRGVSISSKSYEPATPKEEEERREEGEEEDRFQVTGRGGDDA